MTPPLTSPQQFKAVLQEKQVFNPKFTLFRFELTQPHRLVFAAGQYVSIKINDLGERRPYSICSNPTTDHAFELLVDTSIGGKGCQFLQNLQLGQEIELLAPLGRFIVEPIKPTNPLIFVATGSGIAPLRAMILDQLNTQQNSQVITLHWGLHEINHLIWQDEFQGLSRSYPNFSFHPVLSVSPPAWNLCRGRVTDCLEFHPLVETADYYLCGAKEMIADVSKILITRGVSETKIHYEKFS